MSNFHLRRGTTSILPTTWTSTLEHTLDALKDFKNSKNYNSNILGVHLEGPFINPNKLGAQPPLAIKPSIDFVKKVQERIDFEQDEKRALKGIKYHEVVYEQDLEDSSSHQKTIDNILSYLQLESKTVITKHKKVNTQNFKQLIKNYDEFISCINENNWEHFV